MCSAPNLYMCVYILIGTHMVPLNYADTQLHGPRSMDVIPLASALIILINIFIALTLNLKFL